MALTRINNQALTNVTSAGLPSGSIIATYETAPSSNTTVTSTGTADVCSINVTPSSADSKFYISFMGHGRLGGTSQVRKMAGVRIKKTISSTTTYIANTVNSQETMHMQSASNIVELDYPVSMQTIDSPSTTSQVTYAVELVGQGSLTPSASIFQESFGTKLVILEIAG